MVCSGVWLMWSSSSLMLNPPSLQNKTTNVVIQQNSRKLLMMDVLMSETCWAHKKWNKIASDIKLVFYSSNITMTHGPINIRLKTVFDYILLIFVVTLFLKILRRFCPIIVSENSHSSATLTSYWRFRTWLAYNNS